MNALQKCDSTISSPSTPNSSLSSQTNLVLGSLSPNTPSPATPTQQHSATPLGTPITAVSGIGSSGHKNSLKGTKLARRARSFKDDLFEKISLMRTANNTLGRSHSPHSPRNKHISTKPSPSAEEVAKSSQSLDTHVKDISNALKHFRDVILKNKLEVLPGNGTVILETIASMFTVIQSYTLNENSTVLLSATQQVYQSLGELIKLCDEVMVTKGDNKCASLTEENVKEVVDLLENAVKNLVSLAQQKLKEKEENAFKYGTNNTDVNATVGISHNHLMRPPVEIAGQRTSLPDITLTPKERDILEKTKSNPIRASHSTESILRDTSPPPKPPLPNRSNNPPPLPPKRRSQQQTQLQQQNPLSNNISINSDLDCSSELSLMNCSVDPWSLSVRTDSPDENSSQCSMDSTMNHSREEEDHRLDEYLFEDDIEKMFAYKTNISVGKKVDSNSTAATAVVAAATTTTTNKTNNDISGNGAGIGVGVNATAAAVAAGIQNVATATVMAAATSNTSNINNSGAAVCVDGVIGNANMDATELRTTENNRHSNESGYVSMKSFRTSTQSVSKRSSDHSFQSSTKSSNPEIASGITENTNCSNEILMQHQQQQQSTSSTTTTTTASTIATAVYEEQTFNSSTKTFAATTATTTSSELNMISLNDHKTLIPRSASVSPDNNMLINKMLTKYDIVPPALPPKTRIKERLHSQYDNFDEPDDSNNLADVAELRPRHMHNNIMSQYQQQFHATQWQSKHKSLIESRHIAHLDKNCEKPPPLPAKTKHILAYMEICSTTTRSIEQHRHTVCADNLNRNIKHSQTMNIPYAKELISPEHELVQPPALPPKNYKQRKPSATTITPTIITTPPPSPKPTHLNENDSTGSGSGGRHGRILSATQGSEVMSTVCEEIIDWLDDEQTRLHHSHQLPNEADAEPIMAGCVDVCSVADDSSSSKSPTSLVVRTAINTPDMTNEEDIEGIDVALENHSNFNHKKNCNSVNSLNSDNLALNLLEEIEITPYLIFKKEHEDGPEVKGGYLDALIVHASVQKITETAFSEAFITTFRTFIQPIDLIEKLTHRYTTFFCQVNDQKQKAAKNTFSLLVRVVNDLTSSDLTTQLSTLLLEFQYQLVCSGQLYLAKLLRNKIVEKVTLSKELKMPVYSSNMHVTVTNQPSLLDLKSVEIAEQMTLLDAELFQKIEIPEVLIFAKEQCEEKSPNLNRFTEHFNKMSFWARSKILMLQDAKDREKHVIKFIKIMKHLRKMNNYNSYLALLSALDSAPIRRLEWHKTITEGLKEYCTLIDCSSSFRVYRQALAETSPPCIPYIGLVLQDLTFAHVGNADYLDKEKCIINFSKRWTQYNIIINMKRFKTCAYPFKRNERIIDFFENFENFLGEEEMWQISETIKPRGRRTAVQN